MKPEIIKADRSEKDQITADYMKPLSVHLAKTACSKSLRSTYSAGGAIAYTFSDIPKHIKTDENTYYKNQKSQKG